MPTTASNATGHVTDLGIALPRYHRRFPTGDKPSWPRLEVFSLARLARAVDQSRRKYGVVIRNVPMAAPTPAAMRRIDAPGTPRRIATMPATTSAARSVARKYRDEMPRPSATPART